MDMPPADFSHEFFLRLKSLEEQNVQLFAELELMHTTVNHLTSENKALWTHVTEKRLATEVFQKVERLETRMRDVEATQQRNALSFYLKVDGRIESHAKGELTVPGELRLEDRVQEDIHLARLINKRRMENK
ncbi:hypothetical protein H257_13373 [Aphanomyces astaci]|uniref:Cilia- and flagella-associated protein 157 n=1 Tax=Aphanomyces astaci TaxID=112090 RepID=W4FXW9_APHAT|nr:hypothetical protein H257_13373 [Aphanomyces astaci]ETV71508.1 hypothetical protein H257_13373 [Aphanomyces astaci]|eukprot:XP_009839173.1 hypothetical protein H257_13373 [Aphanomyces astaci]